MEDTFTKIWDENLWNSEESASGKGSELASTEAVRRALPEVCQRYDIKRIIDAACGDFHWWPHIEWLDGSKTGPYYLGVDVVKPLIESLRQDWYHRSIYEFEHGDITKHPLSPNEPADLIFARDVFVHFNNAQVKAALENVRRSNAKYLMATTFPTHHPSGDQKTGEWRPINLEEFWGLGPALELVNEQCKVKGFEDKSMGIWRLR